LHEAKSESDEQLSPLVQLQIPSGFHVINFGTKSNKFWNKIQLESSINFKGVQTFWKNLVNSLEFFLDLIFMNVNLVMHTCMQENEVLYKGQYGLVWK
jgi:hypothetical protein